MDRSFADIINNTPYLVKGDKVVIQSKMYLLNQGVDKRDVIFNYCNATLTVLKQYVDVSGLLVTLAEDKHGKQIHLIDDDIKEIIK